MKKQKTFLGMLLCMLLMLSSGIIAEAAAEEMYQDENRISFYFKLDAYGDKDQSDLAVKKNSEAHAYFYFETCNPYLDRYPVMLRLRAGSNNAQASDLYDIISRDLYVMYSDNYGKKGDSYYFRIQTDSNTSVASTASGIWIP